jgi:serine/threonine protein phosphatase 1
VTEADFKEIYIGHTPTIRFGTDKPLNTFKIRNMDTVTDQFEWLTIIDVDTKEYGQSDLCKENL